VDTTEFQFFEKKKLSRNFKKSLGPILFIKKTSQDPIIENKNCWGGKKKKLKKKI
jgi:hypothetical protein